MAIAQIARDRFSHDFGQSIRRLLAPALVLAVLTACGEPPVLPPAKSLLAPEPVRQQWPAYAKGPYALETHDWTLAGKSAWLWLPRPAQDTELTVPLILFSHGNWADADRYGPLVEHWVSHGYAVAAVTHADGRSMARGILASLRYGQMGLVHSRLEDIQQLLDATGALKAMAAAKGVRIDAARIAVAGHSFGAFTAQQWLGAVADDGEARVEVGGDPRIKAAVALSPPGPMFDLIHADSWRSMRAPVLMSTGTWDVNAAFWPEWQAHRLSYDVAPPGGQYALVLEGADHYFGNLICRPERDEAPQWDALRVFNAVSTTFLNAYVLDDAQALSWLESGALDRESEGFATLLHK